MRMGNAHPSIAPDELLNCSDIPLAVACGNDRQFASILGVLGLESLQTDARFRTNSVRVQNRPELIAVLEGRLTGRPAAFWQAAFASVGVPAGQVGSIADGIELARSLELELEPTIEVQDVSGHTIGIQLRSPISWSPPENSRAPGSR